MELVVHGQIKEPYSSKGYLRKVRKMNCVARSLLQKKEMALTKLGIFVVSTKVQIHMETVIAQLGQKDSSLEAFLTLQQTKIYGLNTLLKLGILLLKMDSWL